jgi:hypothetical protein
MDWSMSKIIRIETGSVGISTNDLTALLRLYNVKDPGHVRALVMLAKEARKQTWWSKYRTDLSPTYFQYIEYETSASIIRSRETLIIPGLLQTEEYATAVSLLYGLNFNSRRVRNLVEVQMRRQELLLNRSNPPHLFFIVDEAAIHRLMGAKDLRQAQLQKLIHITDRPEVTIEIVPFSIGLHRGMAESFSILEFDETSDSDVLYFESARDSIFSHDESGEIAVYRELFEALRQMSLGPKGTRDYLAEIAQTVC